MIFVAYYPNPKDLKQEPLPADQLKQAIENPEGLLWVDLADPDDQEIQTILVDTFHFHPLAIEDCRNGGYQTPKVDDFAEYLFITAHAITPESVDDLINSKELNLFLGKNYLVSFYKSAEMPPVEEMKERLNRDERLTRFGADFFCHGILDFLVDEYFPIIDHLDEEIEHLEDRVLKRPAPKVLSRILDMKHKVMILRRLVSPLREVMNRLSRDEFEVIDSQSRIYFRDVYDHLARIQDLSESLRDIISSALDIYLNSTSLRLNEVMKALTIVSTIFLPLSFVAGVYGMNFKFMPELSWRYGYLFVWAIFAAIPITMLIFFKKNRWF